VFDTCASLRIAHWRGFLFCIMNVCCVWICFIIHWCDLLFLHLLLQGVELHPCSARTSWLVSLPNHADVLSAPYSIAACSCCVHILVAKKYRSWYCLCIFCRRDAQQTVYDAATLSLVICQMGEGGAKAPGEGINFIRGLSDREQSMSPRLKRSGMPGSY